MKQFFNVPCALYVHKDDVIQMEQGGNGIGYINIDEDDKQHFELISKHAFQPITNEYVLTDNAYDVVFIGK